MFLQNLKFIFKKMNGHLPCGHYSLPLSAYFYSYNSSDRSRFLTWEGNRGEWWNGLVEYTGEVTSAYKQRCFASLQTSLKPNSIDLISVGVPCHSVYLTVELFFLLMFEYNKLERCGCCESWNNINKLRRPNSEGLAFLVLGFLRQRYGSRTEFTEGTLSKWKDL